MPKISVLNELFLSAGGDILPIVDDIAGTPETKYITITNLSETSMVVLHCFEDEPEKRLTTADLIEKTNLARRTLINKLNLLVKKNLLQRIGAGRNTRYQLTF